jgi:SpoVT / AbrB like domain.
MKSRFLHVRRDGAITLPAELRRRLRLDQAAARIELVEHDDGRLELVPVVAVRADQSWFWAERWQAMEREADQDITAGRSTVVEGLEGLISRLDG